MSSSIKEKISKLLALAESPNEYEAKQALLKAQRLMVEHKLRPEDIEPKTNQKLIRQLIGVTCTKRKGSWKIRLSAVIAENYCCKAFRNHKHGSQTYSVGLIGLADDFEICEKIFKYAVDCIESKAKEIRKQHRDIYTSQYIENLIDAYGNGFSTGLSQAFEEQKNERQEYGLVLITPKEVQEEFGKLGKAQTFKKLDLAGIDKLHYAMEGEQDGRYFNPAYRLEGQT